MMNAKPKLLVSIWTVDEILEALSSDADIIDVKDPSTGSLGLAKLDMVYNTLNVVKGLKEVSVAIGDVKEYSNALDYIVYTLCLFKVNYIKIGIEMDSYDKAFSAVSSIIKTIELCSNRVNIVLVGYADWRDVNSLEPLKIVELAKATNAHGVMIDTRVKSGKTVFDNIQLNYLKEFVSIAHKNSLFTAIAGGLRIEHIPTCVKLGFDVIGVRTAACNGNRLGKISKDAIRLLKTEIENAIKLENA
uniref:(5-formylfuran-3-yl)methyl phosphate synthase n=1 Tax=Ignisphaera aggregans TaxID=334771 RepID=A0A7C5XJV3_9CREN